MDINNIFRVDSHDKFPISIDNLRNYILWFKKFAPKNIRNPYRYFQQNNEHLPIHNPINHFIENPNMIILENYINEENWEKAYTFIHDNNNFLKEENLSIKLNEVRNFMGFDAEFNMQGLITLFYYFFNSLPLGLENFGSIQSGFSHKLAKYILFEHTSSANSSP
jgi:hypothetical protein